MRSCRYAKFNSLLGDRPQLATREDSCQHSGEDTRLPLCEYKQISLIPMPKQTEVDRLNEAGRGGWRVIFIKPDRLAYPEWELPDIRPRNPPAVDQR